MGGCPFRWAQQRSSRCILHTTNHVFGGPRCTTADFDALAEELSTSALILWEGAGSFHDTSGKYHFQVMHEALTRVGKQERADTAFVLINQNKNHGALYADIFASKMRAVVVHRVLAGGLRAHLFCIRLHVPTGPWWRNVDGLLQPGQKDPNPLSAQEMVERLQREVLEHQPPNVNIMRCSVPFLETAPGTTSGGGHPQPSPGPGPDSGPDGGSNLSADVGPPSDPMPGLGTG